MFCELDWLEYYEEFCFLRLGGKGCWELEEGTVGGVDVILPLIIFIGTKDFSCSIENN